jgi:hypothetical protein
LKLAGLAAWALAAYDVPMAKFTAKLTGESDGLIVERKFADKATVIAWLERGGLADFADQSARGEVFGEDGALVWRRSHLQTPEQAEQESRRDGHRLLAKLGITMRKARP